MDAKTLLGAIFADLQESERILICALTRGPEIRRHDRFAETVEQALQLVEVLDTEEVLGVYFGITPRDANGEVTRATCAWADVDAKNFESKAGAFVVATEAYAPPPSFLVDTGNGYHAYWLLSEAVPAAKVREVSKQIQIALGVDPVFDPTRILRVPGTYNRKAEPLPVQVRQSHPHLKYNADDLIFVSRLNSKSLTKIIRGDQRGFRSRSERDWAVVTELARLGVSEDMIFTIFRERLIGDKYRSKGGGDTYLEHTIARAQLRARTATPGKTFLERDDALWIIDPNGGGHMVATFTYDPIRLLEGDTEDVLLGTIRASDYSWNDVPLPKSAFAGAVPLLRNLPVAAWQWLGSDREVRVWLPWLMAKLREKGMPYAKATGTIGRHGEFWVTGDRTFTAEADYSSENAPVVYLRTGRESPRVGYVFLNRADYKALLTDIFALLPNINEPSVVWPALGWFMATPIKPLLESVGVRFPVLNFFGTRGSGKTSTILRVFQPLIGYTEPRSYDCNTTPFVLLALLSSSNSVPVSFSEFRRSTLTAKEYSSLLRYILLAYDVGHDPRGRPDQTTTDYPLSAPFTLDGEDSLASAAAKERAIVVNLSPESIVEDSDAWQAFNDLVELPLQQFAGNYIRLTLDKSRSEIQEMFNTSMALIREAFPSRLPDRVRRNIAVCCLGLQLLTELQHQYDTTPPVLSAAFLEAAFTPVLDEVVAARTGRTLTMVDEFVQDVINQVDLPEERKPFFYRYDPDGNVLWFHLATALNWWYEKRRRSNQEVLESAAIKRQLRERSIEVRVGLGQYMVGRKGVAIDHKTRWSYGVDLGACLEGGLDVPSKLTPERIVIFIPVQNNQEED